jgi:hypothetical protein
MLASMHHGTVVLWLQYGITFRRVSMPAAARNVVKRLFQRVRQAGGELERILPETGRRIVQESIRRRQRHAEALVHRKSQAGAAGGEIRVGVVPRRRRRESARSAGCHVETCAYRFRRTWIPIRLSLDADSSEALVDIRNRGLQIELRRPVLYAVQPSPPPYICCRSRPCE